MTTSARRKRTDWAGERVRATMLEAYACAKGSTPCRVCGRELRVGDHVLARSWHVGFSCVTCGWWVLADVAWDAAWRAAFSGKTMAQDHARHLAAMGLVTLDASSRKMTWTAVGLRLRAARDESARAAKTADAGGDDNHVGSHLSPASAASAARGGRP